MSNIFEGEPEKTFYCWIDQEFFLAKHQYEQGHFISSNFAPAKNDDYLMFDKNPNFCEVVSPFQIRLLNNYLAEYNLELCRRQNFKNYPSRLAAIFLFDSELEANEYKKRNFDHVGKRILRKAKSTNKYLYSKHDCSWIDFLRLEGTKDINTIHNVCQCYWKGITVKGCELEHFGSTWSEEPIYEILYYGRVDFIK